MKANLKRTSGYSLSLLGEEGGGRGEEGGGQKRDIGQAALQALLNSS